MFAGAASGAVTIGLALLLIVMSQKPDASRTDEEPALEAPAVETAEMPQSPPQAPVVLPPPPTAAAVASVKSLAKAPLAEPPHVARPPLKPRQIETPPKSVEVMPLKSGPEPVPSESAPTPAQVSEPERPEKLSGTTTGPAATDPTPVAASRKSVKEGRALLKMLETGKGPVIEIAWPQKPADRARLYRLLTACHGMQTAMLAGETNIYAVDGVPGATWNVNRDAVSGFIRQPAGALTDAEKSVIERIKARHGILYATPVRLFPRSVDAAMLGGLGQIVGPGYLKYRTIRARYRLAGNRITVVDIRVDGIDRPGQVALPGASRCNA